MSQISQINPLVEGEVITAASLQPDINQLVTTINSIDKDNLSTPGDEFSFGTNKVVDLKDPAGEYDSGDDLQTAVTKKYLQDKLFATGKILDEDAGDFHKHGNKSTLDLITDAGSTAIITAAERLRIPTQNQKEGFDASPTPISASNPAASLADITGGASGGSVYFKYADDYYSTSVVAGETVVASLMTLDPYTSFDGYIEAKTLNAGINSWGRTDFNIVKSTDGKFYLRIGRVGKYDVSSIPEFASEHETDSIQLDASSEEGSTVISFGGETYQRVVELTDEVDYLIGRGSNSTGTKYFKIYVVKTASSSIVSVKVEATSGYSGLLTVKATVQGALN